MAMTVLQKTLKNQPVITVCTIIWIHHGSDWGKPESTPHRSVVDVDGPSVACLTIYATYVVVGWWYEHHMFDNLCYIHRVWLVICPMTLQTWKPLLVGRGVELMATNKDKLRGEGKGTD